MRRRMLMFLLGLGVFFGYGGAIASAAWHHRHGHGSDCGGPWSEARWHHAPRDEVSARPQVSPAMVPPTVVVQPAPPAPAAPAQILVIMPAATPAGATVIQASPATASAPLGAAPAASTREQ